MQSNLRLAITELERLLHGLVRICTVTELGSGERSGQVKVSDGELKSTWLNLGVGRAGKNRDWRPLDKDEQVVVLCPSGDFAQGVIIASLYQEKHDPPSDNPEIEQTTFGDGSVVSYDRENHRYLLDIKGADASVDVISAGTLNITTAKNVKVETQADAKVNAKGKATVDAASIHMNGGAPCVTTAHICHWTGAPHGDGSSTVTAGK